MATKHAQALTPKRIAFARERIILLDRRVSASVESPEDVDESSEWREVFRVVLAALDEAEAARTDKTRPSKP